MYCILFHVRCFVGISLFFPSLSLLGVRIYSKSSSYSKHVNQPSEADVKQKWYTASDRAPRNSEALSGSTHLTPARFHSWLQSTRHMMLGPAFSSEHPRSSIPPRWSLGWSHTVQE